MTGPEPDEPIEREEVVERVSGRTRAVRVVTALISVVTGLFAAVLVLHIVLVLGNANPGNAFAQFVNDWAAGVSLGLRDLFTPANENLRVALNNGIAAAVWLIIGAVLNTLISRIALPSGERRIWYRRR